jgi:galactose mutarotase-like enzyme
MKDSECLLIKSSFLEVLINKNGAEIASIKNENETEYMWDANPLIWGSSAPVLFPIIGGLKNGVYFFEGKEYKVTKHGFIRNNKELVVNNHTKSSITFQYKYTKETLKNYPFKFEFNITFSVDESTINIFHEIINHGDHTMFFSLGGHPAFKCPLNKGENYNDYLIKFEQKETSETHLLNKNGLLNGQTKPLLNNTDILPLKHSLFKDDALILKDLKSKKVNLMHKTKGSILSFEFNDFDYLGIWAKPEGDFVCIEPWLGVTDNEDTDGNLKTK